MVYRIVCVAMVPKCNAVSILNFKGSLRDRIFILEHPGHIVAIKTLQKVLSKSYVKYGFLPFSNQVVHVDYKIMVFLILLRFYNIKEVLLVISTDEL